MRGRILRIHGFLVIIISTIFVCGCARGLVKEGPTGESGKGIGLKIPVLNFGKKDAYDAENLSPGNLKEEELNPFQQSEDRSPADPLAIEGR